jgi:hypothetical protein
MAEPDPRRRWMMTACMRLYAELSDGDEIAGMSVSVAGTGGEMMSYTVHTYGSPEIERLVLTDLDGLHKAVAAATIDVTPPDEVPHG